MITSLFSKYLPTLDNSYPHAKIKGLKSILFKDRARASSQRNFCLTCWTDTDTTHICKPMTLKTIFQPPFEPDFKIIT